MMIVLSAMSSNGDDNKKMTGNWPVMRWGKDQNQRSSSRVERRCFDSCEGANDRTTITAATGPSRNQMLSWRECVRARVRERERRERLCEVRVILEMNFS